MWKFIKSSVDALSWVTGHEREICFIGRSNVGKSSLINALTNQKKLAITSSTPGRTKLINFFQNDHQVIVDLPGYGYAKTSKSVQSKIENMIQEYFEYRDELIMVFLLIDSKVGLTVNDQAMIEYLQTLGHNFIIIATKFDKTTQSQIFKTQKSIEKITSDFMFVSAVTGHNIDKLRAKINQLFSLKNSLKK